MNQPIFMDDTNIVAIARKLQLGEFIPDEMARIRQISQDIDLSNEAAMSKFGSTSHLTLRSSAEVDKFLAEIPAASLAGNITGIVDEIHRADPVQVKHKRGWARRFMGADIEFAVTYRSARKNIDRLLENSDDLALRLAANIEVIKSITTDIEAEITELRICIAAGHLHLEEWPESGAQKINDFIHDTPRDRFMRRLMNLAASMSAKLLSIKQMELTAANFATLSDRYVEVKDVLIPCWHDHCSGLAISTSELQIGIDSASRSHNKLVATLEKCAK